MGTHGPSVHVNAVLNPHDLTSCSLSAGLLLAIFGYFIDVRSGVRSFESRVRRVDCCDGDDVMLQGIETSRSVDLIELDSAL